MLVGPPLSFCGTLTPEDLVREVKHLPSAPKVLPRLKQLLCDGNSAMHEIVAFIRLDPGIAARVLQVGNSAYFSKGVRCFTVEEAVNRVGYDQVYELVNYAYVGLFGVTLQQRSKPLRPAGDANRWLTGRIRRLIEILAQAVQSRRIGEICNLNLARSLTGRLVGLRKADRAVGRDGYR